MPLQAQRVQALAEVIQLGRGPGGGAEVAALLEAHDEVEDVVDPHLLPQLAQLQDAVALRAVVALALSCGQGEVDPAHDLGRELGQDVRLAPAQLEGAQLLQQGAPGGRGAGPAFPVRGDELQHGGQVLQAVLHRGAGEGPGPAPAQALAGAADLGLAVLDSLGLIQDDQVPLPAGRGVGVLAEVLPQRLVADEVDVGRGPPLPAALRRRPADGGQAQLGRPQAEGPSPLAQETRRGHQQGGLDLPLEGQDAQRRRRLHRLPQAHVVCQQQCLPGQEGPDAFQLVGEEGPRPLHRPGWRQEQRRRGLQEVRQAAPQGHLRRGRTGLAQRGGRPPRSPRGAGAAPPSRARR